MTALLLVAHGSRDPRAAASTRALVRAVARAQPDTHVRAAYLDHTAPTVSSALGALSATGHAEAVVVPLLLTEAYHGRVDIPSVLAEIRASGLPLTVRRSPVLGPGSAGVDAALVRALRGRLRTSGGYDAVVLAAAGTRDDIARATVVDAADALGSELGVPCLAGYASAAVPTPGEAVRALRGRGARRVAVASYFLAPGLLHDGALASAFAAGAVAASAPLGDAQEIVDLVLSRAALAGRDLLAQTV